MKMMLTVSALPSALNVFCVRGRTGQVVPTCSLVFGMMQSWDRAAAVTGSCQGNSSLL